MAILQAWAAPFRVRSFRFQWPADLTSSLGTEMEILILGWYVLVETGSVQLLAVFASLTGLGILIAPVFGAIGDRIGHRNLFCMMRASYLLLTLFLMTLAFLHWLTPMAVLAIAGVAGLVRSSDFVMRSVIVSETIPAASLTGAMSLSRLTGDSARVAGALAGAGLATTLGIGPAYAGVAVIYLVSLLLTFQVGNPANVPEKKTMLTPASIWSDLYEAILHVREQPSLLVFMFLVFLVNFTAFPLVNGLLPHVAKDIYHLDQNGLGRLVAGYAIGALCGSFSLGLMSGRARPARTAITFSMAWYVLLFFYAHTTWPVAGGVFLFLCGFVQSHCMIMMTVAMMRGADPAFRGRVMSMRTLAVCGLPVGLLVAGPLIDHFGFATTATTYCTVGFALAVFAAVRWRHHLWALESPANAR